MEHLIMLLVSAIALLLPPLGEMLAERSNDPFTILWARTLTDSQTLRLQAAKGLAALGTPKAFEAIRCRSRDDDYEYRVAFALLLIEHGQHDKEDVKVIDEALQKKWELKIGPLPMGPTWEMAMGNFGPKCAPLVPSLVRFIKTCGPSDGGMESVLVAASGKVSDEEISEIISLLRRSMSEPVRRGIPNRVAVAGPLGMIGPRAHGAIPLLETMLGESHFLPMVTAGTALLQIRPSHESAAETLAKIAEGHDDIARASLASHLVDAKLDAKLSLRILIKLLNNSEVKERDFEQICRALEALGTDARPAADNLNARLKDHRPLIRLAAAIALLQIEEKESEPAIKVFDGALRSGETEECAAAVRYCTWLRSPSKSLLPGLRHVANNRTSTDVVKAAETILRIDRDDPEAIKLVLKLLREGMPNKPDDVVDRVHLTKWLAVGVVAKIGPPLKAARPQLIEMLRLADGPVCRDIVLAIRAIEAPPQKTKP